VLAAAGEVGDGGGQLVGRADRGGGRAARGRAGGQVQAGVLTQDGLLQPSQFGSGLDAELVVQQPPGGPVDLQRLGLAAAAVQGQHQLGAEPLPQRLLLDQAVELTGQLAMQAETQLGVDAGLQGAQALVLQPRQVQAT
jgi:hypothetical protein